MASIKMSWHTADGGPAREWIEAEQTEPDDMSWMQSLPADRAGEPQPALEPSSPLSPLGKPRYCSPDPRSAARSTSA